MGRGASGRLGSRRRPWQERLIDSSLAWGERLMRNRRFQQLTYEIRNRRLFSDLFEHDEMLADRVRVDAYWRAIEKHVRPGDVVIDLGTGTGILAFFAAKQGATVHAVEHGSIIEAARAVARANRESRVTFHNLNSRRLRLPETADVLIHEQIGNALLDERVIENVVDLRERVLKPGARIYPGYLDLYIEPVQLREDMRMPFVWQQSLYGVDLAAIEDFAEMSHSYLYKQLRPFPFGHLLCEPEPVLTVDLHTATAADLPRYISYRRTVKARGHFDGYCVYFKARFDDDLSLTTSPESGMTSWRTPFLRVHSRPVEIGQEIGLDLSATDLALPSSWSWQTAPF
jgi:protein arginine N-methyltransferase 1